MTTPMLFYLVIIFILSCVILLVFQILRNMYYIRKLPGPPRRSLLFGNFPPFTLTRDQFFQFGRRLAQEYYPCYKLWVPTITCVNLLHPEDMALILRDTKNLKKGLNYEALMKWLQNGLLVNDGEKWAERRKMLTPAFHFKNLQTFVPIFNRKTVDLVETLKKESEKPYTEVNDLITKCTLETILETTVGKQIKLNSKEGQTYKHAIHGMGRLMIYRTLRPYLLLQWIFMWTPMFFKELKFVKTLHAFTRKIITEKEKEFHGAETKARKPSTLLDLLFACKQEGAIDDQGIQEEIDTFVFEGHDTVSAAICFGLMAIANQPVVQENIVQEIHQVLGNKDKAPNYKDLQKMEYLDRCIREILRLYPSVPFLSRELNDFHVTHDGYRLRKTTTIGMHIYDLHHSPHLYPDPEKFDPDRFLPKNCKDRHPYAYIPFSAGPRNCIGQKFALLEMKAVFCGILKNFVLEPVDTPETIVFVADMVLRTKDEIKVKFVPRMSM